MWGRGLRPQGIPVYVYRSMVDFLPRGMIFSKAYGHQILFSHPRDPTARMSTWCWVTSTRAMCLVPRPWALVKLCPNLKLRDDGTARSAFRHAMERETRPSVTRMEEASEFPLIDAVASVLVKLPRRLQDL